MHKELPALIFVLVSAVFLVSFSGCTQSSVCGDGLCSTSESSLTCPVDCGSSGGNSSGNTGGGSGVTVTHAECKNFQCVQVDGNGINQCTANVDCNVPVAPYFTCAKQSGIVCQKDATCLGDWLSASDAPYCCSTQCIVDDAPPVISIISPVNLVSVSNTIFFTVSASDNSGKIALLRMYVDGNIVKEFTNVSDGNYSIPLALGTGKHVFSADANDFAGNFVTDPVTTTVISPTISRVGGVVYFSYTFAGVPNASYVVERTTSLSNPVWEIVATPTANANGLFSYQQAAVGSMAFFKADNLDFNNCFLKVSVSESKVDENAPVVFSLVSATPVYGDYYSQFVENAVDDSTTPFVLGVKDASGVSVGSYGFYSARYSFWDDVDENGNPIGGVDESLSGVDDIIIPNTFNESLVAVLSNSVDDNGGSIVTPMGSWDLPVSARTCERTCGIEGDVVNLNNGASCCTGYYPVMMPGTYKWVCTFDNRKELLGLAN